MLPEKVTTHVAEAKALLISQFRGRPVIEGLLSSWVGPLQELENVLWDIIDKRILDDAVDAQLDTLGKLVGEKRAGRDNDRYRASIRVRIRVNRSKGRAEDILQVARLLDASATYLEYRFLAWEVDILGTPYGGDFIRLLAQAKAAASYGVLHTSTSPRSEIMRWDSRAGTLGAGHKWSSAHGTTTGGGKWCASLTTNPPYRYIPIPFVPDLTLVSEGDEALLSEGGEFLLSES